MKNYRIHKVRNFKKSNSTGILQLSLVKIRGGYGCPSPSWEDKVQHDNLNNVHVLSKDEDLIFPSTWVQILLLGLD